jgi:hypothetical protein
MINFISNLFSQLNNCIEDRKIRKLEERVSELIKYAESIQKVEEEIKDAQKKKESIIKNLGIYGSCTQLKELFADKYKKEITH